MAVRYTVKRLLVDFYKEWGTSVGLPVATEHS
jgi:hypothetical protein